MLVELSSLINKKNFVVRLPSISIPPGGNPLDWTQHRGHTFPSIELLVDRVQDVSRTMAYIYYYNQGQIQSAYVPKTFQVSLLTGKEKKAIIDLNNQFILNQLDKNLNYVLPMTVGSDPEIFVEDDTGKVIPAFEFLGSKSNPNIGPKSVSGGNGEKPIYWDGFQAEFETKAEGCLGWQVDSVQAGLKGVMQFARKYNPKAKLSSKTVVDVMPEMLKTAKEEHVQFGCMPSLNVYNMKGNTGDGRETPFRPAGGHIHIGFYEGQYPTEKGMKIAVKALDAILGVACVSLFAKFDNPVRRTMYGLAGEYRLPKHGLEYRTLSNAWLIHPMLMNIVFDVARKAVTFGLKGLLPYWKATEKETVECINRCDVNKAREILNRNKEIFISILKSCYSKHFYSNNNGKSPELDKTMEAIFNMIINGLESVIATPNDIESNWNLNDTWHGHSDGQGKNILHGWELLVKGEKVK